MAEIQPNQEKNLEQEEGNRIHEIRIGRVLARIYRNVSRREGVYYRVQFSRRERDAEKVWLAKSFFREDMVLVAKAATASHIWLRDNTDYVAGPALSVFPKLSRVDESVEKSPVHEVQFGNVVASVWENISRAGNLYHKVSFRRGEENGDEVWFWNNFRPEDLHHVAQAATNCRLWFGDNVPLLERPGVKEKGKKNRPAKRKPRRAAK
jgi:hypothetical protein